MIGAESGRQLDHVLVGGEHDVRPATQRPPLGEQGHPLRPEFLVLEVGPETVAHLDHRHLGMQIGEPACPQLTRGGVALGGAVDVHDEAFAALPEGTLESLLEDIPALTDILLYHVVSGDVLAADVVELDSATTVQGSDVTVTVDGEAVQINQANVVTTDIIATNGVIHIIDAVILP